MHVYVNYLDSSAQEICVLSYIVIYSIIYLYSYGLLDVYFILWIILQYDFILLLKLFQL